MWMTVFIHFWISTIPKIAGSSGFKHDLLASVCGHALKVSQFYFPKWLLTREKHAHKSPQKSQENYQLDSTTCWWHLRSAMNLLPHEFKWNNYCLLYHFRILVKTDCFINLVPVQTDMSSPRQSSMSQKHKHCSVWGMLLICCMLPLASNPLPHILSHPFYFVVFNVKDLVTRQHPTNVVNYQYCLLQNYGHSCQQLMIKYAHKV